MGISYTTLGIDTPDLAPEAATEDKLALEVAEVTIGMMQTSGTATVTAGNTILGYYSTGDHAATVVSIVIANTTLTITVEDGMQGAEFKVVMIKA